MLMRSCSLEGIGRSHEARWRTGTPLRTFPLKTHLACLGVAHLSLSTLVGSCRSTGIFYSLDIANIPQVLLHFRALSPLLWRGALPINITAGPVVMMKGVTISVVYPSCSDEECKMSTGCNVILFCCVEPISFFTSLTRFCHLCLDYSCRSIKSM